MDDTFPDRLGRQPPATGVWSMTCAPALVETLAFEGFDFLVLDGEHSEATVADLADAIRAVDAAGTDTAPVVRVSSLDRAELRRVLDFGPEGVIVPQIESAEEAREAVRATAYPPAGVRGVAGGRASDYGRTVADTVATANDSVATILQVETPGIVDAIDDVVAIDGLDALFIGPADLSARLGQFGDYDSDRFREAIDRVVDAASGTDVAVGTLATGVDTIERRHDWGVDFMALGTDLQHVRRSAAAYADRYETLWDPQ